MVAPLFGYLFSQGLYIQFAHQSFKWSNEAKTNAGVFCVIVGMGMQRPSRATLFTYQTPASEYSLCIVPEINAYLSEGSRDVFVKEVPKAIATDRQMVFGNMPNDGGNLIIEPEDIDKFLSVKALKPYIKKLVGSKELLHSIPRYCLWLVDAPTEVLQQPLVADRIEKCRQKRLASKDPGCNRLALRPHEFRDLNNPETSIVVPRVSSERRKYIPMGFIGSDTIATDSCHMVPNGALYDFGILESRMHMTWMRTVCGRLESRYRYSRDCIVPRVRTANPRPPDVNPRAERLSSALPISVVRP